MLKVRLLPLPPALPSDQAMKSWGPNRHSYDPEMWEFEYELSRYLENLPDDALVERHVSIDRNLTRLVSRERDVIPINSFLSSWYWYRKEHQTRLELLLRKISPAVPHLTAVPSNDGADVPVCPKFPNAGDVLFRFGESRYMLPLVERGVIRIGPASQYVAGMPGDPRTDDELRKHSFLPGRHTRVTTQSGHEIPVIGDLRRTASSVDYYVLCMACGYHPSLFADFKTDTCVIIKNADEFARRMERATMSQLPGWYYHYNPLQYFDPYEMGRNEVFDPLMSKHFSFAYQMEYRFVWFSLQGVPATGYRDLDVGPLEDIAFIHRGHSAQGEV